MRREISSNPLKQPSKRTRSSDDQRGAERTLPFDRRRGEPALKICFFPPLNGGRTALVTKMTRCVPLRSQPVNTTTTPEKQQIALAHVINVETPGGTKWISSETKTVKVAVSSVAGDELITLYVLTREEDYCLFTPTALFSEISMQPVVSKETLDVIATPETRENQPSRDTQPKEYDVLGGTAGQLVAQFYSKKINGKFSFKEVKNAGWSAAHLLSYAIANNAMGPDGQPFKTQVPKNIYAASVVLNNNMQTFENVLLKLLDHNEVKAIQYKAIHTVFEDSHVLASLTLSVCMTIRDNKIISFEYPFRVDDNRPFPQEFSNALYALIHAVIQDCKITQPAHDAVPASSTPPTELDCAQQLTF